MLYVSISAVLSLLLPLVVFFAASSALRTSTASFPAFSTFAFTERFTTLLYISFSASVTGSPASILALTLIASLPSAFVTAGFAAFAASFAATLAFATSPPTFCAASFPAFLAPVSAAAFTAFLTAPFSTIPAASFPAFLAAALPAAFAPAFTPFTAPSTAPTPI